MKIRGLISLKIDYQFDNLNRIDMISNALAGLTVNIDHDVLNRRDLVTYPNNTTVDYVYDVASQLTQIVHKLSGTPFTSYNYAVYDNVGNRKQVNVVRPPSVANIATPLDYLYDNLYRLTDATKVLTTLPLDEDYVYDPLGNRLRKAGQGTDSMFDDANRLINDTVYTYTYDFNGNLLTKTEIAMPANVTAYTYDTENQLIRIDFPAGTFAEYKYDGLGRRIQKSGTAVSQTTRYVYDNEDILFEYDGSNMLLARYTHGTGIDEPLVMERDLDLSGTLEATERFFYHTDGLGSIVDLTNSTGAIAKSYVYDSFGNIVLQNGTMGNPYTYAGREYDEESELYYYRARYMDPQTGRFIQEDPIGLLGGINVYSYGLNNPIRFVDPYGQQVAIEELLVPVIIGVGIYYVWQAGVNQPGGNPAPSLRDFGINYGFNPFNPFKDGKPPKVPKWAPFVALPKLINDLVNSFKPELKNPVTNKPFPKPPVEIDDSVLPYCGTGQPIPLPPFADRA